MVDFEEFSSAISRLLDMDGDSDDSEEETIPPEKVQAIWQTICRPPAEEVSDRRAVRTDRLGIVLRRHFTQ